MSLLQRYVIAQYASVCVAIDRMTELAQCDIKINMTVYNFHHIRKCVLQFIQFFMIRKVF